MGWFSSGKSKRRKKSDVLWEQKNLDTVEGVVIGFSNIRVNGWNLPIIEYFVNDERYELRANLDTAKAIEKNTDEPYSLVRVKYNTRLRVTKGLDRVVIVEYDVDNPKEARVIEVL